MIDSGDVQVSPPGGGQRVATYQVVYVETDGTLVTRQLQIIAMADSKGRPIDLSDVASESTQLLMLHNMRRIRKALEDLTGAQYDGDDEDE